MQELEKILEEIKESSIIVATSKEHYIHLQDGRYVEEVVLVDCVEDIIRKHLSRENDTEITRSSRDKWIPVEERLPTKEECEKDNNEFFVQTDSGERFSCEYDPLANGYDNPLWCCNVPVIAWRPLPEPYRPEVTKSEERYHEP